ncbi:ferrous iron transport protein B [Methylococcaceae bacterium HT1]|nr:ferrous iron transport protein B [Methylococcaceae bacterium HT1]TXL16783.1 ferrous iron transport protein B [Methylococcaceae bacterium HT3]TXL23676.1 ferrous iron transport protein B [Methylococcaceae bacterium HT2]
MQIDYTVAVVGNPNCGKTTLFNVLTGARQHVGNWPGVTVEKKTGEYTYDGKLVEVVDLPGTYSLESDSDISLDERVARDFVAAKEADLIINILDASNIERNLYLTSQLIEMRVPMIVVLNMMDVVARRGLQIDIEKLAEQLASPVIAISASTRQGIKELKDRVSLAVVEQSISHLDIEYPPEIEKAITTLSVSLQQQAIEHKCNLRWLAIRLLERDALAKKISGSECAHQAEVLEQAIENATDDEVDILAADARYGFVNQVTHLCVNKIHEVSRGMTNKIDKWVLNRYLGIPIFLLVMYLMFMITINIGSAFIDFFDQVAGAIFVDGFSILLSALSLPEWLVVLLANGAGGGVQVVATFIPIIGFLFLVLSLLEDSGYMARAAFVVDRFMGMIGLPGKSFVPMIVGFGCNVPAIMATRTLESQRDRILTNIMNPFMSCGARLPVYALFAAAFFPVGGQNLVFGLYVFGILVAVFTGLIMRHTLFKGESMPFIMELPNYHLPTLQSIVIRTWDRLKTFLVNAGKVIVPMVLVLNFLNSLGTDGSFGKENTQKSVLSEIGRTLVPVFQPMGIREDNWPATVGIFTGILAKEAVVGTLDALYSQLALDGAEQEETVFDFQQSLLNAVMTIPENLMAVADNLLDPLGLNIGDVGNMQSAAEEQEISHGTFGEMQARFDGQAGAFAYLLFILLYAPCVAATAAIQRETGTKWTIFIVSWTTGIAYMTATIFYQLATYTQHRETSLFWVIGLLTLFGSVIFSFWLAGRAELKRGVA